METGCTVCLLILQLVDVVRRNVIELRIKHITSHNMNQEKRHYQS